MQPTAVPPPPTRPAPPIDVPRKRSPVKRAFAILVLLGLAFLGGYVPEKLRANRLQDTLKTTTIELELANAHRHLGVAALEAQRNNFANASAAAVPFFDACARLANNPAFNDEPRTRTALGAYAGSRDAILVQLATADPTAAQRLASLYFTMEGVLQRRE